MSPIGSLHQPGKATVEGRVRVVEIRSVERNSVLACEISDSPVTSPRCLRALPHSRPDVRVRVRLRGPVGIKGGAPVMVNPAYELIVPYPPASPGGTTSKNWA